MALNTDEIAVPFERSGYETGPGVGRLASRLLWPLASLGALLALWQLVALALDSRHFPGLSAIGAALWTELLSGRLGSNIGITLLRVFASFVLAMGVGSAIGLVLGRRRDLDRFFDSWLIFFLNLPALVTIILCYVWFGLTQAAAILAVSLNKIPNVAVQMREGARSLSKDLDEMAQVYRFGWRKTLLHVTLPQLAPFFAAAARSGLSLVWKIVLFVEALGLSTGVGYEMHVAFAAYDVPLILAYAVAFIIVVQAIELLILQPLEARANRWRR
jgi:NitT/TauT family transport system permease protein